jgi:pyruvate/2-oxoglutarate dehydrogenase complex dihydrolipoamide dehydrogenase (E3) component
VRVNDYLQTTNPRIYAAGDVCMNWKFTHAADAAAKIAVTNALFLRTQKLSSLVMPWCTYTDPEVAHVGMYERDAQAEGIEIDTYQVPLREVNRAVTDGEDEGFVKIHAKRGSDRILGATIVATHAGEMLSEITLAIAGKLGLRAILKTIHPYPTQAEGIKRAAGLYVRGKATPRVKRWLARWMALRR